jgi:hypothetical protein
MDWPAPQLLVPRSIDRQADGARRTGDRLVNPIWARGLLTEFSALHPGTTKQLAVLLLRHALATLLDY